MDVHQEYLRWKEACRGDGELYNELSEMANDKEKINDAFYCELAFGTGGLRGIIGAGTNRMNIYTVGRATRGLAKYLFSETEKPSAVIAYDSRNKSAEFARLAAEILSENGIKAYLFFELMPTPVLSFAVRYLHATAGIVITASHNPKVYNEKGGDYRGGGESDYGTDRTIGVFRGAQAERRAYRDDGRRRFTDFFGRNTKIFVVFRSRKICSENRIYAHKRYGKQTRPRNFAANRRENGARRTRTGAPRRKLSYLSVS